jgi:hypothetical protein
LLDDFLRAITGRGGRKKGRHTETDDEPILGVEDRGPFLVYILAGLQDSY